MNPAFLPPSRARRKSRAQPLAIAGGLIGIAAPACFSVSPVVHWALDEESGTVAVDGSGNGVDGAWQGTAGDPAWVPGGGVAGGAVSFAGSSAESFIAEEFAAFDAVPCTISLWVNTSSSENDGLGYLGNGATGNQYYVLRMQGNVARANARNTSEVQGAGSTPINDGQWHHLVAVFEGDADRRVYVDGVLDGSSAGDVPGMDLTRFGIGALARNTPYNPADLYAGLMDDASLWDVALGELEIGALYALGAARSASALELEAFLAAFEAGVPFSSEGGVSWERAEGLGGFLGETGGSLAAGDLFVVLDANGAGMRLTGPPAEPVVAAFSAAPVVVFAGEEVTLQWSAGNADTVAIEPGVGEVATEGSATVNPEVSTTYTLTATNANGTASAVVMVEVIPAPPPRELLLHWPLDEGEGTTTADLAGAADGEFFTDGGTPEWGDGLLGGALVFPDQNNVSVRAFTTLVDGFPFTMAGWVQTTASANDTFANLGTGQGGNYHSLRVVGGSARMTTRNSGFFDVGGPAVNDGDWHFIVGVFSHPGLRELYVDGEMVGENRTDSGPFVAVDRFAIGALDRTSTSVVDPFGGSVDDVSFWRGILSADEVAALYGGAVGLGLDAGAVGALLDAFGEMGAVEAAGVNWVYREGLGGAVGDTAGSVLGGDATLVLDGGGNGMAVLTEDPNLVAPAVTPFGFQATPMQVAASVTLRNSGQTLPLNITGAEITGAAAAAFTLGEIPAAIPPGGSVEVALTFDPGGATGHFAAALELSTDDPSTPVLELDISAFIPLSPDLVALYRMDEPAGEGTLIDASGFGRPGVYTAGGGTVERGQAPLAAGTSARFAGGAMAEVPAGVLPTFTDFAISLWAEVEAGAAGPGGLVSRGSGQGDPFALVADGTTLIWFAGGIQAQEFFDVISPGSAHHITLSQEGSNLSLYVDGTLAGTASNSTFLDDPAHPLQFGALEGAFGLSGRLDEIQVYSRPVSDAEAAFLAGNPGLVLGQDAGPPTGMTELFLFLEAGMLQITWPLAFSEGRLYGSVDLVTWTPVAEERVAGDGVWIVNVPVSGDRHFYRLQSDP